ncbi:MAG TPA: hypothetical protein VF782_10415 [Allosphingosinicella sp.]|jgi:hypothetical protein
MGRVARFQIARSPDLALAASAETRGWSLLTTAQSAQSVTASPAGLLLTPVQAAAIAPLAAWKAPTNSTRGRLFDSLHDRLHGAFLESDHAAVERLAAAFLKEHPPVPPSRRSSVDRRVHSFFSLKGRASSAAERLAFHDSIPPEDRNEWFRSAPARMDREKAQALAAAATGAGLARGIDLLGGLHSDLAFSVLDACLRPAPRKTDRLAFPDKYVDRVLLLEAFLPEFVFELDPCVTRAPDTTEAPSLLAGRLERLNAYDEKIRKIAGGRRSADGAGHSHEGAAREGPERRGEEGDGPDECDCTCEEPPCLPIDPCCSKIGWYVSELLTLRDETHCYKPSDIAYIENVAPWETRIRSHDHTRTVSETSEDEVNVSRSEERDHQVTDRFSLQKEIETNQTASLDVDAKLSGKAFGQQYELKTSASLSRESSYREAREQARETVERAALKMQVQTRKLRTRTVTTTTAERNKHKFKNDTARASVQKYFWVTQVKRGQLFSHGPRITLDLLAPSPSLLFQHMEKAKRDRGFTLDEPIEPAKPALEVKDITRDNYLAIASQYGLSGYDSPPPQRDVDYVHVTVRRDEGSKGVTIPPGYTATAMDMLAQLLKKRAPVGFARIRLIFGGGSVEQTRSPDGSISNTALNERNSGSATIDAPNATDDSYITARITLTPDSVDLTPWQKGFHAILMTKYEDRLEKYKVDLDAYNEARRLYDEKYDAKITGRHPFACEEIMRTELKRLAIFMLCGEFDWPDVMNMNAQPCGGPWPNRKAADKATNEWYFFDSAFDWNLASFTFYDYFRNPMCKWVDSYEPDEPNFLFKAFLRAGYARMEIPVAPGMEEDIKTYLQTGGLWGRSGKRPSNPHDPGWTSVVQEIKHSYDCFQQDREGHAEAYPDPVTGAFGSRIRVHTDRYWDPLALPSGAVDVDAINLDLNHEIFIDGIAYRILSIAPDPAGPAWSPLPGTAMRWIVGLDRGFESDPFFDPEVRRPQLKPYNYAVGALFVGAPFHFDLPTDLIWIGDQGNPCLPCYPIECACDDPEPECEPLADPDPNADSVLDEVEFGESR